MHYLIDNDVIILDSLLSTIRKVVSKDVHDSVKELDHKQRGNWIRDLEERGRNVFIIGSIH